MQRVLYTGLGTVACDALCSEGGPAVAVAVAAGAAAAAPVVGEGVPVVAGVVGTQTIPAQVLRLAQGQALSATGWLRSLGYRLAGGMKLTLLVGSHCFGFSVAVQVRRIKKCSVFFFLVFSCTIHQLKTH